MTDLAPCPFCAGVATLVSTRDAPEAWVRCSDCDASAKMFSRDEDAVAAWNQRAINDQTEALAQWMHARGIATGHGETVADLLTQLSLDYRRAPTLRWRSEPPDVPGRYWIREIRARAHARVVRYSQRDCDRFRCDKGKGLRPVEWAGPIPAPEEGE